MGNIIVALPKQEDSGRIGNIIRESDVWEDVIICTKGAEILRTVQDQSISIVICTKRLVDMGYEELANYLSVDVNIILLTKDSSFNAFSSNVMKLMLPFHNSDLINTIKTLLPYETPRRQKKKPLRSPEEQKVIDNAKAVLMDRNAMTEPEAFRYMQKTSMDTHRTMLETAQMILIINNE